MHVVGSILLRTRSRGRGCPSTAIRNCEACMRNPGSKCTLSSTTDASLRHNQRNTGLSIRALTQTTVCRLTATADRKFRHSTRPSRPPSSTPCTSFYLRTAVVSSVHGALSHGKRPPPTGVRYSVVAGAMTCLGPGAGDRRAGYSTSGFRA